jgi:hypothetical protein
MECPDTYEECRLSTRIYKRLRSNEVSENGTPATIHDETGKGRDAIQR